MHLISVPGQLPNSDNHIELGITIISSISAGLFVSIVVIYPFVIWKRCLDDPENTQSDGNATEMSNSYEHYSDLDWNSIDLDALPPNDIIPYAYEYYDQMPQAMPNDYVYEK